MNLTALMVAREQMIAVNFISFSLVIIKLCANLLKNLNIRCLLRIQFNPAYNIQA